MWIRRAFVQSIKKGTSGFIYHFVVPLDFFTRMNFENPSQVFKADEPNPAANPNVIAVTKKDSEEQAVPDVLSVLPVRGMVIFPGTVVPLSIRRAASLKMLDETLPKNKTIGLLTQKQEENNTPGPDDLYHIGVAGSVLKLIRQSDEVVVILVQALHRIRVKKFLATEP